MKTMRDRTKKDNDLPAAAAGSLFPYKISWLKMPQGFRKVEMIQLFPGHYGTVTIMVAAAGGTGRNNFNKLKWFLHYLRQPYGYMETRLMILGTAL